MSAYLPLQWKEYLHSWMNDDRESFLENIELKTENYELAIHLSDKFLNENNYELYLRFKEDAENDLQEINYMKSLLR